jgi:hypothetical protein
MEHVPMYINYFFQLSTVSILCQYSIGNLSICSIEKMFEHQSECYSTDIGLQTG